MSTVVHDHDPLWNERTAPQRLGLPFKEGRSVIWTASDYSTGVLIQMLNVKWLKDNFDRGGDSTLCR